MRHPLISFFVLAYGLTWPVIPLVSVSPLLGLPALFGPAFAAIIVVAVTQGKTGLKDLLSQLVHWRGGLVRVLPSRIGTIVEEGLLSFLRRTSTPYLKRAVFHLDPRSSTYCERFLGAGQTVAPLCGATHLTSEITHKQDAWTPHVS